MRQGAAEIERGNRIGRWPSQHRIRQQRHAATDQHSQQQVTQTACPSLAESARQWRDVFVASWQPAQAQQNQHGGDYLHHQLGQGQVRGREPDEGDADHQSADADHGQCRETVIFGLPRGAECAGNRNQPQRHEHRRAWNLWSITPGQATVVERNQSANESDQDQQK